MELILYVAILETWEKHLASIQALIGSDGGWWCFCVGAG